MLLLRHCYRSSEIPSPKHYSMAGRWALPNLCAILLVVNVGWHRLIILAAQQSAMVRGRQSCCHHFRLSESKTRRLWLIPPPSFPQIRRQSQNRQRIRA